jgi:hypothetical protein
MRIPASWLLALTVFLALPAAASPRVTLRLEKVTLHEAIRRLSQETGIIFRTDQGAGQEGFQEPPGAARVDLKWENAPLGAVIRELCSTFALTPVPAGDEGFWFQSQPHPKPSEVISGRTALSLASLHQSERTRVVPGAAGAAPERRLDLGLVLRALDGDADTLGPLTRLSLTDSGGRTVEVPLPGTPGEPRLPDERCFNGLSVPWNGEPAARLRKLEAELSVYERVEERRLVLPLPLLPDGQVRPPGALLEQEVGAVHLKVLRAAVDQHSNECRPYFAGDVGLRLEWPAGVDVVLDGLGSVRGALRTRAGISGPLRASIQPGVGPDGARYAECRLTGATPFTALQDVPAAIELIIPVRCGAVRKVAFQMENVTLPFGRPHSLRFTPLNLPPSLPPSPSPPPHRVPDSLYDREGGALRLDLPSAPAGEPLEAAVGLSRRNPDGGWSPVRWVQVELESGVLRLEGLAPGVYRARLRLSRRLPDGRLRPSGTDGAADLEIRKGAETVWDVKR